MKSILTDTTCKCPELLNVTNATKKRQNLQEDIDGIRALLKMLNIDPNPIKNRKEKRNSKQNVTSFILGVGIGSLMCILLKR
jgi:hypothetical protein